jgi:hypothetical protein
VKIPCAALAALLALFVAWLASLAYRAHESPAELVEIIWSGSDDLHQPRERAAYQEDGETDYDWQSFPWCMN